MFAVHWGLPRGGEYTEGRVKRVSSIGAWEEGTRVELSMEKEMGKENLWTLLADHPGPESVSVPAA